MNVLLPASDSTYMKGKSRNWFWPVLAFLLLGTVANNANYALTGLIGQRWAAEHVLSVILAVITLCCWACLLLVYAFKNKIKVFKVVFIILACSQLLMAVSEFLSNSIFFLIRMGYSLNIVNIVSFISLVLVMVARVFWIVCALIVAFNRKSITVLRISSVLVALFYFYMIVYSVSVVFLTPYFFANQSMTDYSAITTAVGFVNNILGLGSMAFFFASMSFGRQRKNAAAQTATISATGTGQ